MHVPASGLTSPCFTHVTGVQEIPAVEGLAHSAAVDFLSGVVNMQIVTKHFSHCYKSKNLTWCALA